jgi:hypothetical protein
VSEYHKLNVLDDHCVEQRPCSHGIQRNPMNSDAKRWTRPRDGFFKAKSDANLSKDGVWGLGSIIRDETGSVLAAASWVNNGFNDPLAAEVLAMWKTMRFTRDCCFTKVIFETDCANLIRGLISSICSTQKVHK